MTHSKDTIEIEVETLQSGQPRPYADSFYEAKVRMKKNGQPMFLYPEAAIPMLKAFVRNWHEKPEWYQGTLRSLTGLPDCKDPASYSQGKAFSGWHVLVCEAYTD